MRARIDELGPWFHNIDIVGTPTKTRSFMGEPLSYPAPLWGQIRPLMPELAEKRVLDIGCNAGFFSIQCKQLGAAHVVGVDVNQGTTSDFVKQARFAASALQLDIEFRHQDFMDVTDESFDVVLFLGVLYHLPDPIAGLHKAAQLAKGTLVVETAAVDVGKPVLQYFPAGIGGDRTSPWAPSPAAVDELLMHDGFGQLQRPAARTRRRYVVAATRTSSGTAKAGAPYD